MVSKIWNGIASMTNRTPKEMRDLRFGPETRIFRFGSLGGAFVITGLGAGYALWSSGDAGQAWDTSKRIAAGFVPLLGTELDAEDMIASFKEGRYLEGAANTAAFLTSGLSDILLATGILSWAGV